MQLAVGSRRRLARARSHVVCDNRVVQCKVPWHAVSQDSHSRSKVGCLFVVAGPCRRRQCRAGRESTIRSIISDIAVAVVRQVRCMPGARTNSHMRPSTQHGVANDTMQAWRWSPCPGWALYRRFAVPSPLASTALPPDAAVTKSPYCCCARHAGAAERRQQAQYNIVPTVAPTCELAVVWSCGHAPHTPSAQHRAQHPSAEDHHTRGLSVPGAAWLAACAPHLRVRRSGGGVYRGLGGRE